MGLLITGIALTAVSLLAMPDALYWLPDALMQGGYYWGWLLEESMPVLMMLTAASAAWRGRISCAPTAGCAKRSTISWGIPVHVHRGYCGGHPLQL